MLSQRAKTSVIIILSFLVPASARAESTYDQPYLGKWPKIYYRYSARSLSEQSARHGPEALVRKADVIILGAARNLTEIKVTQPVEKIQFYEADVDVVREIKGALDQRPIHLKFTPSATSIEDGAEHVFFIATEQDKTPAVIGAWYVYPERFGLMRVVGAYNCPSRAGMQVLQHLVSGKQDATLAATLVGIYRHDSWGHMYSAAVMAAAVAPEIGHDLLVEVVSTRDRKRFDFELYCTAAHALAKKQGDAGLRVVLKNIPKPLGTGRVAESVAFDLVATYGTENIVPDIKALVAAKPEFAVSAAFAMSQIGGRSCRNAIASLLGNQQLAGRSEKVFDGYSVTRPTVPELLKQARDECSSKGRRD